MLFSRGKKRAILFADVSGSSALYKVVGNEKAKATIDKILKVMIKHTNINNGRVVKTIGDEIMASFEECDDACRAAVGIQRESESSSPTSTLGIRIGIGYGKTLKEGDDLFGESVNDAAFVTGIAKSSQILMTDSVAEQLANDLKTHIQEFDNVMIKGSRDNSTIFRMFWKTPTSGYTETQVFSVHSVTEHLEKNTLHLKFFEQEFDIQPDDTPFIIGRNESRVTLFIDNELVSRDHCHIEFRRGKFVLIDHSTNGTYIKPEDGPEIYLRREELPLLGNGNISLGISHEASSYCLLTFSV